MHEYPASPPDLTGQSIICFLTFCLYFKYNNNIIIIIVYYATQAAHSYINKTLKP